MKEINLYRTEIGKCPVEEFLDTLSNKEYEKVHWVFDLIESQNQISTEYLKKLVNSDNIWEIRARHGNNAYRFLGFFDGSELILLNHAFQKKSQKTPQKEIKIAEKRKKEYLNRRER